MTSSSSLFGEELLDVGMERYIGQTAVVTGASSGIGRAICEVLVKLGINVVGVARRVELIEEMSVKLSDEKGKLYPRKCDLRDEMQLNELFEWIENELGAISIMINNAGLMFPTSLLEGDPDEFRATFDVNVLAICICTKKAIESMRAHNVDGYIIHMNSITGHYMPELPVACLNVYPATKYAVTALTEQLRRELRSVQSPNIKISAISPGLVSTDFIEGFTEEGGVRAGMKQLASLQPADIADTVIYVLSTPTHVQIHDIIVRVKGEGF